MKIKAFIVFLIQIHLAAVPVFGGQGSIPEIVAMMTDKTASWENRCAAEDELATQPPQRVLSVLLPHIAKGMPSPMIWNSGGRELDKQAPVEWQVFYAVARSWNHAVAQLPKSESPKVLLSLLKKAPTPTAQQRILNDMVLHWTPDAEDCVADLLTNKQHDFPVRWLSGLCLMIHEGKKYHDQFLHLAKASDHHTEKKWFDLLSDPRHKQNAGYDPRVVALGFRLIEKERTISPNYVHGAYFLAIKTGNYIGVEFKPDQRKAEYQGEHGLKEVFFSDTVKNALAWWESNKERIRKELPPENDGLTRG
jgi:hypothetical protein